MFEVRQDESSEREVGRLLQRRVKLLGGHAATLQSQRAFNHHARAISIFDKKIEPRNVSGMSAKRVARTASVGFGFAFVTCRDRFTVKHGHQMSRFRDVCTLGTHDDIMHYVRTLNIYELFNDTARPASINYAFFHPFRAHACISQNLMLLVIVAIGSRVLMTFHRNIR